MINPLISVIVPVYNTQEYLDRCIRSIMNNTYSNLEIICVNDGSTDKSLEILTELAKTDSRIRIIDQENGGVSTARNYGLAEAKGEYICFVDSDDWIHTNFFEVLITAAEKDDAYMTVGMFQFVNEYNDTFNDVPPYIQSRTVQAIELLTNDGYFRRPVWGRIYKRCCIGNIRFAQGVQFGEDLIFNILVGSKNSSSNVTIADVPLYFYYQSRADSLVNVKDFEAEYKLGCWFIDNFHIFDDKRLAIICSYGSLLTYRYESGFSSKSKLARKKANLKMKINLRMLWKEKNINWSRKLKYTVLSYSPFIYRAALIFRDPSYIHYEKFLKKKHKEVTK